MRSIDPSQNKDLGKKGGRYIHEGLDSDSDQKKRKIINGEQIFIPNSHRITADPLSRCLLADLLTR